MKNKLFLLFNKQAIIMEETKMVQMTSDRVKRVALETIESEIPDVDYMPKEVFDEVKKEIPYGVGVLVPSGRCHSGSWYDLKSIKKAKRMNREKPISEMLLMMFRSAARDRNVE